MPEFDDTLDDCNRTCPYCGHSYQVEVEDYDEDEREETCGQCGKKYWAFDNFSVTLWARPDCALNGEPHQWGEPHNSMELTGTYHHCDICGEWERIE